MAKARVGELLKPLADPTSSRRGIRQIPQGISYKTSHEAQTIAKNPIFDGDTSRGWEKGWENRFTGIKRGARNLPNPLILLVGNVRFELTAFGFGGQRSIQLS